MTEPKDKTHKTDDAVGAGEITNHAPADVGVDWGQAQTVVSEHVKRLMNRIIDDRMNEKEGERCPVCGSFEED